MQNNNFTKEEISKFNFYNSGIPFFDDNYEFEDEYNLKLNNKAANINLEILKLSKSRKIALFKDKNKIYYTSLQGCNCKQYDNSENNCCVHMFKLAQLLEIIDIKTGILLYPQTEFDEIPFEEVPLKNLPETKDFSRKYEPPSNKGIGKHCKQCNAVIDYEKRICPSCGQDPDKNNSEINYAEQFPIGCLIFAIILIFVLICIFT